MNHQPVSGEAREGKTEVKAQQILSDNQPEISGHGQQEVQPEATCLCIL